MDHGYAIDQDSVGRADSLIIARDVFKMAEATNRIVKTLTDDGFGESFAINYVSGRLLRGELEYRRGNPGVITPEIDQSERVAALESENKRLRELISAMEQKAGEVSDALAGLSISIGNLEKQTKVGV